MENMEHNVSHTHSEGHDHSAPKKVENKKNVMMALGAVAIVLIVLAAGNFSGGLFGSKSGSKALTADEAKAKAEDYINKNLVEGTTASITAVEDYSDSLYKLKVKVGDTDIDSYITKDGKYFFPQAMEVDGTAVAAADGAAQTPVVPADLVKSDKPEVEVFVMSHCPYGTQVEKGLVPVMETLKDKANIKIKFVNYIMHQAVEKDDNLVQYCIDKEDNTKYVPFLKCFLKDGNSAACMTSTGVNVKKVQSCISATDKQFKVTEAFNDKTKWSNGSFPPFAVHEAENVKYGVQGSPTIVINGKQVESERSPAGLLATICAAFNNAPAECSATLDTATPGPGFGDSTAANTGAGNAACAPS
jgi:protein-disulfide isomerase